MGIISDGGRWLDHECAHMQTMNASATAGYMLVTGHVQHIIGSHEPGNEQGPFEF